MPLPARIAKENSPMSQVGQRPFLNLPGVGPSTFPAIGIGYAPTEIVSAKPWKISISLPAQVSLS
jgi:hypothetical protein